MKAHRCDFPFRHKEEGGVEAVSSSCVKRISVVPPAATDQGKAFYCPLENSDGDNARVGEKMWGICNGGCVDDETGCKIFC